MSEARNDNLWAFLDHVFVEREKHCLGRFIGLAGRGRSCHAESEQTHQDKSH